MTKITFQHKLRNYTRNLTVKVHIVIRIWLYKNENLWDNKYRNIKNVMQHNTNYNYWDTKLDAT
jgi:hypothetical protein